MRLLRRLGVLLIVVGAVLLAGPAFGFSTIAADRSVQVLVAEDEDAILGITPVYDGAEITNNVQGQAQPTSEPVVELTNRFGHDIASISVVVTGIDGFNDGALKVRNHGQLFAGLEDGETKDVVLECSGSVTEQATDADVTLSIDTSGGPISITEKTTTVRNVSFDCTDDDRDRVDPEPGEPSESSPFDLVDSSLEGDSGVRFTAVYDTGDPVTITALEVRETSHETAAFVDNGGGNEVDIVTDSGNEGYLNTGGGTQNLRVGDGGLVLDESVEVESGDSFDVVVQEFEEQGNGRNRVDMTGKDVKIVLYFESRSAVSFELEDLQRP